MFAKRQNEETNEKEKEKGRKEQRNEIQFNLFVTEILNIREEETIGKPIHMLYK